MKALLTLVAKVAASGAVVGGGVAFLVFFGPRPTPAYADIYSPLAQAAGFLAPPPGGGPKLRVRAATARRIRPSDRFVREVEAVCGAGSVVLK